MIESIVLGIIQGIFEWLPVSSEGLLVLIQDKFYQNTSLSEKIETALFLHLGTFLAAFIYFRKDIEKITLSIFTKKQKSQKNLLVFLITATIISSIIAIIILKTINTAENFFEITGKGATLLIGAALIITGIFQLKIVNKERTRKTTNLKDAIFMGIAQGLSALPGLSRSGLTVATMLFRGIEKEQSLKLSFLLSLPIVLIGNILLNLDKLSSFNIVGLVFSFAFGILTIDILLKFARKINLAWFIIGFGALNIASTLI